MPDRVIVKGEIGNALHSVAPDHITGVADDIFDEGMQMYQSEINSSSLVYDISANHLVNGNPSTYDDLADALGVDGANIPEAIRKGGMSVKFVQSSDNKYMQYRCIADEFTTDVTQWQGIEDSPKSGSKNLVDSNGIWITVNGNWKRETYKGVASLYRLRSPYITVSKNTVYCLNIQEGFKANICFYVTDDTGTVYETNALNNNAIFSTNNYDKLRIVVQKSGDGVITLNELPKFSILPFNNEVLLNTLFKRDAGIITTGNGRISIYHPFYIGTSEPTITSTYGNALNKVYYDENMNVLAVNTYSSSARYVMFDIIINDGVALTDYSDSVGTITINGEQWAVKSNGTFEHLFADKQQTENNINLLNLALLEQSTDGDNTNNLYHGLKDLELGSLDSSGSPTSSTTRLRSKDYIELPLLDGIPHDLAISINSIFKVMLVYYNQSKEYISDTGYINSQVKHIVSNARYMKLLVMPYPDYVIPVSDWAKLNLFVSLYQEDNISLKQRILVNTSADLFDTANSILKQEWINKNAAGSWNNTRLITVGFIPIKPFTNYVIKKLVADNNHYLEAQVYDKDFNRIKGLGWNESFFSDSACYVKFLYKYGNDENVSPITFVPFSVTEQETDNTINYYPKFVSGWEYGSVNDAGTNPETTVNNRARTDIYPIKSPGVFEMSITEGWGLDIYFFDSSKTLLFTKSKHTTGTLSIQVPIEAKFFRLKIMPIPDSSAQLNLSEVAGSGCNIYYYRKGTANSYLKHLKLTQWNMGLLNYGISTGQVWGIPNEELDAKLPDLKDVITRIDADVLFINEYSTYVDRNQTMQTYDTLFHQFYGYKFTPFNGNVAIMSKYPMNVYYENDVVNRPYITGEILVDGHAISFCLLHFSPFSYADRTTEINALITKLSSYTKGIVVGDFNFGNNSPDEDITSQIALFTAAGYVVGNYGYWGIKPTYTDNVKALDNICVKGMNMSSFDVLDDASVSDHYPTYSKISFLIEK